MAKAILTIGITQAGCRTGELLEAVPQRVKIGEANGKVAVAIYAVGSKMDPDNQKSAPIVFTQLEDKAVCPVTFFMEWLQFVGFKYTAEGLCAEGVTFLFPAFSNKKKRVETSFFSKQVGSLL